MRRGLARSREHARQLVIDGRVTVGGAFASKPDRLVDPGDAIVVAGPPPRFVGRGGDKLAGALAHFGIDPTGRRFLDAGASTGGFTDCLLQHGAAEVVAVDVGHGQLDARLRDDPRVRVLERTHVRDLTFDLIGGAVEGLVVDLSFISLRTVVGGLLALCAPGAPVLLLVKPQFEAGRQEAARGRGVIRDPVVWRRVLQEVNDAASAGGASIMGAMVSPLRGHEGNAEFFLHGVAGHGPDDPDATGLHDEALDAAVSAAGSP